MAPEPYYEPCEPVEREHAYYPRILSFVGKEDGPDTWVGRFAP